MESFRADSNYFRVEWEMFKADPGRASALLDATHKIRVERVLDIGCGAGQEMLPFVAAGATGVGIDLTPDAGLTGREMFARERLSDRVNFLVGSGTNMPFEDGSFDVLICRVALMYMDNKAALAEMSRVLRPRSILLLKYHGPAYYCWKFVGGVRGGYFKSSIHAIRVLFAGVVYQLTGKQFFGRLTAAGEIFQTRRTFRRELAKVRLRLLAEMPDSNIQTPSFVIVKE
jgi:ubiquinone/menaquinone biosynthesis C-methylase UbiE